MKYLFILFILSTTNIYSQTLTVDKQSNIVTLNFTGLESQGVYKPGAKFVVNNDTTYAVYTVRAVYRLKSGKVIYKTDKHKFVSTECDFIETQTYTRHYAFSIDKN